MKGFPKTKKLIITLLYALFVFTSGCAVMTVDVDVYKGPLADHLDVQTEQLAAMAVGVEPILEWLEQALKRRCFENDSMVFEECDDPVSVRRHLDDPVHPDDSQIRILQILDAVTAVRNLYRDVNEIESDAEQVMRLLKSAENAGESINIYSQVMKAPNKHEPNKKLINRLKNISKKTKGQLERACLAKSYLHFLVPDIRKKNDTWRDENAIFSLHKLQRDNNRNKKYHNPYLDLFGLIDKAQGDDTRVDELNRIGSECLTDDYYDNYPANWGFYQLQNRAFLKWDAKFLFGEKNDLTEIFVKEVSLVARSFPEIREAMETIFLNVMEVLRLFHKLDFRYQLAQEEFLAELSSLVACDLIDSRVANSGIPSIDNFLKNIKSVKSRSKCIANEYRTQGNLDFRNNLYSWIMENPAQAASQLLKIHRNYKELRVGPRDISKYRYGITRWPHPTDENPDIQLPYLENIEMLVDNIYLQAGRQFEQTLNRGRSREGLYTLIEDFINVSNKLNDSKCDSEIAEKCKKSVERDRLLDGLARYSRKLLVLADHQPLFINDGFDERELKEQIDSFTRILQAVGNALRIQVNDLRSREAHVSDLADLGITQVKAMNSVFASDASTLSQRLLSLIDSELEPLNKELSKLPKKPESKPALAFQREYGIKVKDPDGNKHTLISVESLATAKIKNNKIEITGLSSDKGIIAINYEVEDDTGLKAQGHVVLGINVNNSLPITPEKEKDSEEDKAHTWTVAKGLPANSKIALIEASTDIGEVTISANKSQITFVPPENFSGKAKIKYTLSNDKDTFYKGDTTITVSDDGTDAPLLKENAYLYYKLNEQKLVNLAKHHVTDPDQDEKHEFSKINPADGEKILNNYSITTKGILDYKAEKKGGEIIKYKIKDKSGNAKEGSIYVWVGTEKEVAQFDIVEQPHDENTPLPVTKETLFNEQAEDGLILNLSVDSGKISRNEDGSYIYIPPKDPEQYANLSYVIYRPKKVNQEFKCDLVCSEDQSKPPLTVSKARIPIKPVNNPPAVITQTAIINEESQPAVDPNAKKRAELQANIKTLKGLKTFIDKKNREIISRYDSKSGERDISTVLVEFINEALQQTNNDESRNLYTKYIEVLAEIGSPIAFTFDVSESPVGDKPVNVVSVIDQLLTLLRAKRIWAAAEGNDRANTRAERALLEAYRQKADVLYIRPALAYLQSAFTASDLLDNNLAWRNLLSKHAKRAWLGRKFSTSREGELAMDITEKIDVQYWHPINQVRVAGGGSTNYVIAKDDLGNWYVKGYENDMSSVINAARSLATFAYSAGGIAPRLDEDKLQDGEVEFRTDQGLDSKHTQFKDNYEQQLTAILDSMREDAKAIEENLKSGIQLEDGDNELKQIFDSDNLEKNVDYKISEDDPLRVQMLIDRINSYWAYYQQVDAGITTLPAPEKEEDTGTNKSEEKPETSENDFESRRKAARTKAWDIIVDSHIVNYTNETKNAVMQYKTAVEIIGQFDD